MKNVVKLLLLVFGLNLVLTSCTIQELDAFDNPVALEIGNQDSDPPIDDDIND